ncbi:putative v-type c subunit family protein [Erysiphe neolycopersici]|uniref:Putative v-type c subunit family protein n=1 Tax=Erysiphe neolycopersici TaxID=212602 RepID=A0A420HD44_9PEZI|nr:putative v-type c subunit family protein [Erysiphe neolycopersici]
MLRRLCHIGMSNSFVHKGSLKVNIKYFKPTQNYGCQRANINTKFQPGASDQDLNCSPPKQLKSTNCVSLRLSQHTNVEDSRREIIKFFKPYLQSLKKGNGKDNRAQSLVVLATPNHIAWLENKNIREFISQLFLGHASKSPRTIEVICACVDGLAPNSEEINCGQLATISEGISVFMSTSTNQFSDSLPTIQTSSSLLSSRKAGIDDECSLSFQHGLDINTKSSYQTTIPLANTIFTNGRRSTLIFSKWQITENGINQFEGPILPLNILIDIPTVMKKLSLQISAKSLTEPRLIENGFGNIVRKLKAEGQNSFPASHELEKVIAEAHRKNALHSNNGIWALVIPHSMLRKEKTTNIPLDINLSSEQELDNSYLESLVKNGAKIFRVLSGGGGWGAKEGLLALDPIISFGNTNEHQVEQIVDEISIRENREIILGNMAQEGALIQFLQTADRPKISLPSPRNEFQKSEFVFGCQIADSGKSIITDSSGTALISGLFGCISETGVFFQSPNIGSTKIDMPYSYIYSR